MTINIKKFSNSSFWYSYERIIRNFNLSFVEKTGGKQLLLTVNSAKYSKNHKHLANVIIK